MRASSVALLLFLSRPPAIRRPLKTNTLFAMPAPVPAGIVDSVDRVLGRGLGSHVDEERLERLEPSMTHVDAARSICRILAVCRNSASPLHPRPGSVLRRARTTVRRRRGTGALLLKAAARGRVAATERVGHADLLAAAITSAPDAQMPSPVRVRLVPGSFENHEAAESVSVGDVRDGHCVYVAPMSEHAS